jgi:DNA-binding NtrC family response regulator
MVVRKTCFFIDNDADNLATFTRALTHVTPETICFVATNVEDAVLLMIEERLVPSCIFVAEAINGTSADKFLSYIKRSDLLKDVPVIVHGTQFSSVTIKELKALGALAIYTKPFTFLGVSNMLNLYFRPEMNSIGQN